MSQTPLTPDEFEMRLEQLEVRLRAYLETGEGKAGTLSRVAEEVLSLSPQFPDVYAKHGEVEGLVAEMLARQTQSRFMAQNTAAPSRVSSPGCLLGWLRGRRR
ncbi:MAG: hypothetical protein J7M08_07195 [Planctomycetes bacterium]|nr:hypothetical protein [Planctomycetota bacterium]